MSPRASTLDYRVRAIDLAGGKEAEVDAVAHYLHRTEPPGAHENVAEKFPCGYCFLRAGKIMRLLNRTRKSMVLALCPVCKGRFQPKADERMRFHYAPKIPGEPRRRCLGVGEYSLEVSDAPRR